LLFVACAVLLAASLASADAPFRLRLVREAADVQAAAEGGGCVRGRLYLVREFNAGATGRGVWIADTLEPSAALRSGVHAGVARDDAETGWHIELPASGTILRAQGNAGLDADADILIGRRGTSIAGAEVCDPARDALSDGAAILRRLRDAYASPDNQRAIQVSIES
jgi:hypothetical protein